MSVDPDNTLSSSQLSSSAKQATIFICRICNKDSSNDRRTIKCNNCNHAIHYPCSRLPRYVLATHLKKKSKKFDCEVCTSLPEDFEYNLDSYVSPSGSKKTPMEIPTIRLTDENGMELPWECDSTPEPTPESTSDTEVGASQEERKIVELNQLFEKYDFVTMAENLLQLGNKMESISTNLNKALIKANPCNSNPGNRNISTTIPDNTNNSINPNTCSSNIPAKHQIDVKLLCDQLEFTKKDRDSYRHSYELVLQENKVADGKIWDLSKKLHEKDSEVKVQAEQLKKNANLINDMNTKIKELTDKLCDVHGKWEAGSLANQILGRQLDSYMEDKSNLEKKLELVMARLPIPTVTDPKRNNTSQTNGTLPASTPAPQAPQKLVERCTILHDSLMKRVN